MTLLLVNAGLTFALAVAVVVAVRRALRGVHERLDSMEIAADIDAEADRICDRMDTRRAEDERAIQADLADRRRNLNRVMRQASMQWLIHSRVEQASQLLEMPGPGGAEVIQ